MNRRPKGGFDPDSMVKAMNAKQLDKHWSKAPPTKDDQIMALQFACDPELTKGPTMTPCTSTQICLTRPCLLRRLIEKGMINLNQRQLGYNATLLHILTHLYWTPPALLSSPLLKKKPNPAAARKRLVESAAILLEAGADPTVPDDIGSPPLPYALQYAGATGDTGLAEVLLAAAHGPGDAGPQEVAKALKMRSDQILEELKQLAQQLAPAPLATNNSSTGSGTMHAMTLPPAVMRRAQLLVAALEQKARSYDQVLDMIPFAGVPELFPAIYTLAHRVTGLHNQTAMRRGGGMAARVLIRASPVPVSRSSLAAWVAALRANPRQLGLYAMARWNTNLHKELLQNEELMLLATEGAKGLIEYAQHKAQTAGGKSSSSKASGSNGSSIAATVKRHVAGFQEMALSTTCVVSWLVVAANIDEVTSNMSLFKPLWQKGCHHQDLLTLLGMGHAQAVRGAAALCFFPEVALEALQRISEGDGTNPVAQQLAGNINAVVKRAVRGHALDFEELRYADHAAKVALRITVQVYALLYRDFNNTQAAAALMRVLPAVASLKGSPLAEAMAAAAALKPSQFKPPPGMPAAAMNPFAGDVQQLLRNCKHALQGIKYAADEDQCGKQTAAAAAALGLGDAGAGSSSSSSSSTDVSPWSEQMAGSVIYGGLCLGATPNLPITYLNKQTGHMTVHGIEDRHAGRIPADMLAHASLGYGGGISPIPFGGSDLLGNAMASLQAGAAGMSGSGSGSLGPEQLAAFLAAMQMGASSPYSDSTMQQHSAAELASDARRVKRSDNCCWHCGKSPSEAVAAGLQVSKRADGKPKLLTCSRCRKAVYCCGACQKAHWKQHKPTCQAPAAPGQ